MAKPIPSLAELVDYKNAVAGHDGTLSDVDGELFVKPCTPAEVAFYDDTVAHHPAFAEYMPTYLGTLSLNRSPEALAASIEDRAQQLLASCAHTDSGPAATEATPCPPIAPAKTTRIDTDLAVVLENTAHGFIRPNILDIKLGVRLYADYAQREKKVRFDKLSAETTHHDLGFRIGGMRIWQGEAAIGEDGVDDTGYRVYDKNYGRFEVNTSNVHAVLRTFLTCERAGVTAKLGRLVAQAFDVEINRISKVLEADESRMYSASLLFVYEGDGAALRAAVDDAARDSPPLTISSSVAQHPVRTVSTTASLSEDDSDNESHVEPPKIFSLKMIDFAHACWTPGQGPDENQLLGIRSLAKILGSIAGS